MASLATSSPAVLRRINSLLFWTIIIVNLYIIFFPVVPAVTFWWRLHVSHVSDKLAAHIHLSSTAVDSRPAENRLIIPRIGLDYQIFDGPDMRTLAKGPWHRPQTSTPDKGSNTVIAAHRFTYTKPQGDFYNLDKVRVGDEIAVFWQKKEYLYAVTETKVVPPSAVEVEAATSTDTLTLYTCTPLWLPKDRLVVTASLREVL